MEGFRWNEDPDRHRHSLLIRQTHLVGHPPLLTMKPAIIAALVTLAFTGCRTTTEYRPDGGKTVIREADPMAIKLAGTFIGGAVKIHQQK
jgi:hypothetical protein